MAHARPLLLAAIALAALAQPKPDKIRVSTWVREDLFAGYMDGDMTRHAAGMKKLDAILAGNPKAADAVAWKAASTLLAAVRSAEAGDTLKFDREFAASHALYQQAASIAQEIPDYRGAVLAITGGSFTIFADRLPPQHRAAAWQRVRENYTALRDLQQPNFNTFPPHFRGEVMAGLAQAAARLGEAETARTLTAELVQALPGTPYAVFGKRWLDKPETTAIAKAVGGVVATWREVAGQHGLTANQIDRMASAFEHEDLARAIA